MHIPATFAPARHRKYSAPRIYRRNVALAPAKGIMLGFGICAFFWAGLAYLIF